MPLEEFKDSEAGGAPPQDSTLRHAIALVLNYEPREWGTREEFFLALCRGFRDRGYVVVLVCSARPRPETLCVYEANGVFVEVIDFERPRLPAFLAFRRLVRRHRIQTAYLRFFGWQQPAPWLVRLCGIRRIFVAHVTSGMFTATSWKKAALRVLSRLALAPVRRNIAISDFVKRRLESLGVPGGNIDLVYNGINLRMFVPNPEEGARLRAELGIPSQAFVVSTVSYLVPRKRVDVVIDACQRVVAQGVGVWLLIAGEGPLEPALRERAAAAGLGDCVKFLGYRKDVARVFQASDAFVFASEAEAFGYVLVEAMACGIPVVATGSGAHREIVVPDVTGLLVPVEDVGAFAAAIASLAQDPESRCRMGFAGAQRAREFFSVETTALRTVEVCLSE